MTTRRPSPNILLIALAAIVGTLSLADVASACPSTKTATSRACCANRKAALCGCCGDRDVAPAPTETARAVAVLAAPARMTAQAGSPSCECRASEPAAPSERPTSRTTSERNDLPGEEVWAVVIPAVRPSAPGRFLLPNESPPGVPLYLGTSHLLI